MKTETFNAMSSWHQKQKKLLNTQMEMTSEPLELATLPHNIFNEEEAAQALSEYLETPITLPMLFLGVPYNLYKQVIQTIGAGYVYTVNNLGWLIIWKNTNKIFFLDKNVFGMEKCYRFQTREAAQFKLIQNLKIRVVLIVLFIVVLIISSLCN